MSDPFLLYGANGYTGELIAREAGAITSDFGGAPARPAEMLAAAPGVYRAMLEAVRSEHRTD